MQLTVEHSRPKGSAIGSRRGALLQVLLAHGSELAVQDALALNRQIVHAVRIVAQQIRIVRAQLKQILHRQRNM